MSAYIVTPPKTVSVPVLGSSKRFPVRRIYCVGRNYAAHVREMGGDQRDLQLRAKQQGNPWDTAKAFDRSAPITAIQPLEGAALPASGSISLAVNDVTKQSADLAEMIWSCAEIIATLSTCDRLEPGDLIYTGTPAGVGPVQPGDRLVGHIDGLPELEITIAE